MTCQAGVHHEEKAGVDQVRDNSSVAQWDSRDLVVVVGRWEWWRCSHEAQVIHESLGKVGVWWKSLWMRGHSWRPAWVRREQTLDCGLGWLTMVLRG